MDMNRWIKQQWDRALAIALVIAGGLALLFGAAGVARSVLATQQIPYAVSGGLTGLFLLGLGTTLWLSADLRDEWRVLDDIRGALRTEGEETPPVAESTNGVTAGRRRARPATAERP